MAYQDETQGGLDYAPCRYGTSRNLFRGPPKRLDLPYIAVLGSTETYGKFVAEPYPDLIERRLGLTTVNFGCANAGLDLFLNDHVVMQACADASITIVQIVGAQTMSNRFYTVHPRRNDRFVMASKLMQRLWPEIDFAEIHFTRHLLQALKQAGGERFERLRHELAEAWVARMRGLVRHCGGRVILLWLAERRPEDDAGDCLEAGPVFVTREMVEALRDEVTDIAEVVPPRSYGELGAEGKVFAPLDAPAAARLPGPQIHAEIAEILARRIPTYL